MRAAGHVMPQPTCFSFLLLKAPDGLDIYCLLLAGEDDDDADDSGYAYQRALSARRSSFRADYYMSF